MRQSLVYLTIFAAGLVGLSLALATAGVTSAGRVPVPGTRISIDTLSFTAGLLAGLVSVWLAAVPWSLFPALFMRMMVTWRRNIVLASLAAACAGVLLFY